MTRMQPKVKIGDRWVGDGEPIFVVVEAGTTSNGNLDTALKMVDAAKEGGADAIKFMMIDPDYFMSDKTVTYEYEWAGGHGSENMYEMFQKLRFSRDEWKTIRDYCIQRGIIFYATVDYLPGVDEAEEIGFAAHKLSSWDANNFPLIRRMAQTGKPIQIDLGPTTLSDIEAVLEAVAGEGNSQVLLVHCTHAKTDGGINVRSIPFLKSVFQTPVGYSADTRDFVPDLASVALGANMIEKRLTLDRGYPGHHHVKAVEPDEFKDYVAMLRRAEAVLGEYRVIPSEEDLRQKPLYFVSLTAAMDIPAGTVITPEMLVCKRPGTGIPPQLAGIVAGRTARRDISRNEQFGWDAV